MAARFAEGTANGKGPLVNPHGRYRVFRHGDYKLAQHSEDGTFLYNLTEDPGELNDLAASQPEMVAEMTQRLQRELNRLDLPALDAEVVLDPSAGMDKETCESLLALGYVESCDEYE